LSGEKEKAIADYKRAIEEDDHFAQSYLSLGNLYLEDGNFQASKDIFFKAAKKTHSNKDILYGLAFSLEQTGELSQALTTYGQALKLEHDPEKAATIKTHMAELQARPENDNGSH
jgi:tetratricopeptide (TPR) repeat protein